VNFYKRYMGDYARDTAHLSLMEHGAYTMLLDTMYATEKPLPIDRPSLYRICRATSAAERKAVDNVADQFFPVNGDGSRHNPRVDKELADAHAYADAQAMRAHMRWHKQADMPKSCPKDASHSHSHKEQSQKLSSGKPDPLPGFIRFWTAWPKTERKQGKGKCLAIWKRKRLEDQADAIVAHVEKMAQSESWRTGFDPMPETYLNGQRWDGAELDSVGKTALGECMWNVNGNRDPDAGKCTNAAVGARNNVPYCQTHLGQVH
jgi:uncharacterized protein YdaU (DUF1376 family)